MSGRALVLAGGGTGGHLYPGLAIWRAAHADRRAVRAIFACSDREIDARILQAEGVEFRPIRARPPSLRPAGLLRFLCSWGPSVRASRALIRSLRAEGLDVQVVALGGFVAAPVVQGARAERAAVTLVNLDAVPGRANRWIARRATTSLTTLPARGRDWPVVGPIVRADALAAGRSRDDARRSFGLDPGAPTLLVSGGSLGARSINRLMVELASERADTLAGWQVVHQTGEDAPEVAEAYERAGVRAHVTRYLAPMGPAWAAADLALCRAGAGTVCEVWANRVPALFMPYPYHRDDHQRANAAVLESAGAAATATDRIDPRANLAEAGAALADLLGGPGRRAEMSRRLASMPTGGGLASVLDALDRSWADSRGSVPGAR